MASWACRSDLSLERPRCRPILQGEMARRPPQVARLQRALQALQRVLVLPGLRVGVPSSASSSSSSSFSDSGSSSRRSSLPRLPVAELLPLHRPWPVPLPPSPQPPQLPSSFSSCSSPQTRKGQRLWAAFEPRWPPGSPPPHRLPLPHPLVGCCRWPSPRPLSNPALRSPCFVHASSRLGVSE